MCGVGVCGVGCLCHPGEGRVNHKPEDLVTARENVDTIIGRECGQGEGAGTCLTGLSGDWMRCDEVEDRAGRGQMVGGERW